MVPLKRTLTFCQKGPTLGIKRPALRLEIVVLLKKASMTGVALVCQLEV